MRRIISALLFSISSAWAVAQDTSPIELAPYAPDRHIVVPGDTLWGIASKFLKDPARWPDVWRLNPDEVKNPHRIYPGQVIVLDRSGRDPQLKLGRNVKIEPRIYTEELQREIPSIPQQAIEPFLSMPLVVDEELAASTARIVATQENRVFVGSGDAVYATGVKTQDALWHVYRPGKAMRDPDFPDPRDKAGLLGYEAVYLGNARLTRPGEPATLEIATVRQEIGRDDLLMPAGRPELMSYMPRVPTKDIQARIVSIYGGLQETGPLAIVSLSRGKRDGVEMGHVLALYRAGNAIQIRYQDNKETHRLPDERYGSVFVFRVFERVSYGLVMNASRTVAEGDVLRTR